MPILVVWIRSFSSRVDFRGEIYYNTDRFVGVKRKVLNIDKAKREIKWTIDNKMHSLEDGLIKTIDFYRKEYLK